jgi:hypothetical protein
MTPTSPSDDLHQPMLPEVDQLLSAFFQAQLPSRWPAAPVVGNHVPSTALAVRGIVQTVDQTTRQGQIVSPGGTRARWTLVASVAILLGGGWLLLNGFEVGPRPSSPALDHRGAGLLEAGTAANPKALETLRESKATQPTPATAPSSKIDLP